MLVFFNTPCLQRGSTGDYLLPSHDCLLTDTLQTFYLALNWLASLSVHQARFYVITMVVPGPAVTVLWILACISVLISIIIFEKYNFWFH